MNIIEGCDWDRHGHSSLKGHCHPPAGGDLHQDWKPPPPPPKFKMFITIKWTIHTTIPWMLLSCMYMASQASRMNCLNYVYK